MDGKTVYQKLKEAVEALDEYEKNNFKSIYHDDIKKQWEIITERKHMLSSSGQVCPRCNGSGRS